MYKLFHFLHMIKGVSLPFIFVRLLKKVGAKGYWLNVVDFLSGKDFKRPLKSARIISDALASLGVEEEAMRKLFDNSSVMEIGCGRYGGIGAYVAFEGAKSYTGLDPLVDDRVLGSDIVRRRFFVPAFNQLQLQHPNKYPRNREHNAEFTKKEIDDFLGRCGFLRCGLEEYLDSSPQVDVCVSISCLEHIRDFSRASHALAKLSHSSTFHFHIVNFSSHLSKEYPFAELYERSRDKFLDRWNYNINGLRKSDMQTSLERAGLKLDFFPLDIQSNKLPRVIDPSWSSRYSREELSIRTGVFRSPTSK